MKDHDNFSEDVLKSKTWHAPFKAVSILKSAPFKAVSIFKSFLSFTEKEGRRGYGIRGIEHVDVSKDN